MWHLRSKATLCSKATVRKRCRFSKMKKRIKKARIGRSHGDEGFETNQIGSEEMELNISLVLEKIENFTQRYLSS
ncbi:hypothetical protein P8452_48591 [Trifolium repens]|nr:hypothetical protein P8452_48591 [Trifolium repens]